MTHMKHWPSWPHTAFVYFESLWKWTENNEETPLNPHRHPHTHIPYICSFSWKVAALKKSEALLPHKNEFTASSFTAKSHTEEKEEEGNILSWEIKCPNTHSIILISHFRYVFEMTNPITQNLVQQSEKQAFTGFYKFTGPNSMVCLHLWLNINY